MLVPVVMAYYRHIFGKEYPSKFKNSNSNSCILIADMITSLKITNIRNFKHRVRTGYGILEKLWNFEKEIPYMEKLWNLSKTDVPMEKLWNFRFGGKKCVLSLKKMGGK